MSERPLAELTREELIRELEAVRAVGDRAAAERERLIHDLQVQQAELEAQNHELRDAQHRLEAATMRYADLYDFAPVGYCTLDAEGRIVEINLTAAAMLGAARGDLLGRQLATFVPLASRRALADHLARCRAGPARVTSELALAPRAIGEERILQVVSEPIVASDQPAPAYRTSLIDVTARKQLELDLRLLLRAGDDLGTTLDRERMLDIAGRVAVPTIADLCMIDLVEDGTTRVERSVVVVADPGQAALAEKLRAFKPRPGWQSVQARVLASGEPVLLPEVSAEVRDRAAYDDRHAGILRALDIRSELVVPLSARGRVFGALTLAVGTSGRRYTQVQLDLARALASRLSVALDNARLFADARQAIAAREATLALVSHDLRTPLGVILMRTGLLRMEAMDRGRTEDASGLEVIHRSAERMRRLIQDLVDAASMEAGQFSVERVRQPLAPLLGEMVEALSSQAAARSLALECELPVGARLDVECDRGRIEQVLGNLIGNAIKFTPVGGRIVVRGELRDAEVWISVADTGPGIPPDDLPHVFERYWQARDTAHLGSGLGLAIAQGIVAAHGGRIWAESQVGSGSTFLFALPRAAEAREPVAAPSTAPVEPAAKEAPAARVERAVAGAVAPAGAGLASEPHAAGTVLVVDDDPDARDVLGEVLAHHGYDVAKASNGAEALTYLRREPAPALILLDIAMPVMDGWTFLTERERDPALREIPVLVMSGHRDVADRVAAFRVGYLVKPVPAEHLLVEVGHAVH